MNNDKLQIVANSIKSVLEYNPCGGNLHVIISDGNMTDDSFEFCKSLGLSDLEKDCWDKLYALPLQDRIFTYAKLNDSFYDVCYKLAELLEGGV